MTEWTIGTLKEHMDALRAADQRALQIKDEGEKEAKRIKNEADKEALKLAREIQTYKDEAHNGLLKQWQFERGTYVTTDKFEATIKPLVEYVSSQQGSSKGSDKTIAYLVMAISVGIAISGFVIGFFK